MMEVIRLVFVFLIQCMRCGAFVKYKGCRIDPEARENDPTDRHMRKAFVNQVNIIILDIQACVTECWNQRYNYAALQNGESCFCGSYTHDLEKVNEEFCFVRCRSNCVQRCGGPVAMSVFATGYKKEPDLSYPKSILDNGLRGCFDLGKPEAVKLQNTWLHQETLCEVNKLVTERLTPHMCILFCNAHQKNVAATMSRDRCCCAAVHTYRWWDVPNTKVDVGLCNLPCAGNRAAGNCYGLPNPWHMLDAGLPYESRDTFEQDWVQPIFKENFEEVDTAESYARELEIQEAQKYLDEHGYP